MYKLVCYSPVVALFLAFSGNLQSDPIILNSSPGANAGDAIYLQGSGFGTSPVVQYSFNDNNWKILPSVSSNHDTVVVKLPTSERKLPDLVTVRLSSDNVHWSKPAYLNRAHAMSFDTTHVAAGDSFRIFGRNLYFGRTPTLRFVDTSSGAQSMGVVDVASSSEYILRASASTEIQSGHSYRVYVSNAYNGNASSGAETLADEPLLGSNPGRDFWNLGVPWAADLDFYSNVYNVRSDARLTGHASGSGSNSDIDVIRGAIWTAYQAGGGIVHLPAGTYNLVFPSGCGFTLLPRVAVVGDGPGKTIVNYGYGNPPSPDHGGYAVCFAINQSGISDLSLNNVNESGRWPQSALATDGNELFIQRVNWNIGTSLPITLPSADRLAIENSTFNQGVDSQFGYSGILQLSGVSHFLIRGNNISFACGGIVLDYASDGVFENNNVVRDASGNLPADNITHVMTTSFVSNFVVLNNSFSVQNGTLRASNNGETINNEAGGANRRDEFRGTVTSFSDVSVTDANQNFFNSSNVESSLQPGKAIVAIVSGTGMGQWRKVTGVTNDGHTLYLDQPWLVAPAAGSHYATFDWSASNWVVAGNKMSGNEKGIEIFNASAVDLLFTSNTLTNNSGILLSPEQQAPSLSNLIARVQILNNKISDTEGLRPAYVGIVPREDGQSGSFGISILGAEARGNNVLGQSPNVLVSNTEFDDSKAQTEGFNCYWQWQTSWAPYEDQNIPASLGTVLQANNATNSRSAFELDSAIYQTMIDGTFTRNVGRINNDVVIPGATHASVGTGMGAAWTYTPVGGILEQEDSVQTASSVAEGSAFLVTPARSYISRTDAFGLVSRQESGNVSAVARIALPANADASTSGVVMMRDTVNPNSAFASVGPVLGGQIAFSWRNVTGGSVETTKVSGSTAANWLKLARKGNTFTAYRSADGVNWAQVGQSSSAFSSPNYNVGLAAMSNGSQAGMTVRFDKVDIEPN